MRLALIISLFEVCYAAACLSSSLQICGLKATEIFIHGSGRVDLLELIPLKVNPKLISDKLKTRICHEFMAIEYTSRKQCRKPSAQDYPLFVIFYSC